MERCRNNRRKYDARLCPFVTINITKIFNIKLHGISQKKKCNDDIRKIWNFKI